MTLYGINKVIIAGNPGQAPEIHYMSNGGVAASLSLAAAWRKKKNGAMRENTEWHRVVLSGQPAEVASEYLHRGTQIEMMPLSALVKSPLNVRAIPYPTERIRGLADTILALGLIKNLEGYTFPGGRCLAALQLLLSEQRIDTGYLVIVKRVSDELEVVASMVENNQRVVMHPAEQISGFRVLSELGNTTVQISDPLGYSSRHVQRMLKLSNLITLLAEDNPDVEQCQTLSPENEPARQVHIYQPVKVQHSYDPVHIPVTDTETGVNHCHFVFTGCEMYESAGGVVREELFSAREGDATADGVLVACLVQESQESAALAIKLQEEGAWPLAGEGVVKKYGNSREHYLLLPEQEGRYTTDEQQRLAELYAMQEATETFEGKAAIQVRIDETENTVSVRTRASVQKADCGVVVSLNGGELCIRRGRRQKSQNEENGGQGENSKSGSFHVVSSRPGAEEGNHASLLKKESSESSLAVQAVPVQPPEKAVALRVWRLCRCFFDYGNTIRPPFVMRFEVHHNGQTSTVPTRKSGPAWMSLMQEKAHLKAMLPEGWKTDSPFFTLDGQLLMSLMAFCTACPVDGVQARTMGYTPQSNLVGVDMVPGFHLCDWGQPAAVKFPGLLCRNPIAGALKEAGLSGVASDAGTCRRAILNNGSPVRAGLQPGCGHLICNQKSLRMKRQTLMTIRYTQPDNGNAAPGERR